MCGIAGLWSKGEGGNALEAVARAMGDRLRHRGPDDAGVWVDRQAGIGLAHRRLSIIDLSPLGRQPMESADGRWLITYNGEIYNYRDIAKELTNLGVRLRGASDTEVLLEAIARWGIDGALCRTAGMFAFAVWDRAEQRLFLARDRLGIKPLFYAWWNGSLLFASELKAFRAVPGFAPTLDRDALTLYLRHCYVPAPWSIWREARKLPPGHVLECRTSALQGEPRAWWSAEQTAVRASRDPFRGTPEEGVDELGRLLGQVVEEHMVSDVPLGAFLSGGIDSSTVVALMQARSARAVRTFTIGFEEDTFDEAAYARRVAEHLGTDHTELTLRSADAESVIPSLPDIWDEPFADSSQIPTYLVARLARESVTVALSGDGGDELFGGYSRYAQTLVDWGRLRRIPEPLRRASTDALAWSRATQWSRRARSAATVLRQPHLDALYRQAVSYWPDPAAVVVEGREPATRIGDACWARELLDPVSRMMLVDSVTYLPDDILTKVDRASMAVSLEARVPILDHRVFELAWRLPSSVRVPEGEPKWFLRKLLSRSVPSKLFERPKQGFAVPIATWLRGPLRGWCEDLLSEERLRREGVFHSAAVRTAWRQYLRGWPLDANLWVVLMFQAWSERRASE